MSIQSNRFQHPAEPSRSTADVHIVNHHSIVLFHLNTPKHRPGSRRTSQEKLSSLAPPLSLNRDMSPPSSAACAMADWRCGDDVRS